MEEICWKGQRWNIGYRVAEAIQYLLEQRNQLDDDDVETAKVELNYRGGSFISTIKVTHKAKQLS